MIRQCRFLSLLILIFAMLLSVGEGPIVYAKDNDENTEEKVHHGGGGYAASNQLEGFGYTTKIYDSTNGLPTSDANYILCSDYGYIWFGGYSGIIRYDGSGFERLDSYDGLTSGRTIFQDSKGQIWVGTNDNGVVVLDEQRNRKQITDKDGLPSRCIRSIVEDGKGNFIIGTSEGVAFIDKNETITHIDDNRIDSGKVIRLTCDAAGDVYGYCDNGYAFHLKDGKLIKILKGSDLGIENITTLIANPNEVGKVYIGTNSGNIYYGDFGTTKLNLKRIDADPLDVVYWISYDCGRIWASSRNYIGYIDDKDNFSALTDLPMDTDIEMLTSDYQGNLWIASSTQGVMKIVACNFYNITKDYECNDYVVYSTYLYNNRLYIGCENGLFILGKNGKLLTTPLTEYIGEARVRHINVDSKGNIWVCVYNYGYGLVCQKENGEIVSFTMDNGLASAQVRCTLELSDGTIAVGGNRGINFIKDFEVQKRENDESEKIDSIVLSLCEKNGDLYITTDGDGIYILTDRGIRCLTTDNGLSSDVVMRIKWDEARDVFWLITSNSIQYIKNDIVVTVSSFPYNNCYDIYFERNTDDLWVLASNGIYLVNAKNMIDDMVKDYRHFNILNGMPSIPTANAYSFLDDESNMYVSSRNGVCKFDIDKFVDENLDIKFAIHSVISDGVEIYPDESGKYVIPAGANRITFVPAILDYAETNPKVHVSLDEVADDGITCELSQLRPLDYTGLKYGTYNLRIQLLSQSGNEVIREKLFTIEKKPLFFEMILVQAFMVFMFVVIGGILAWRILLRTTISKQYIKLQEMKDELVRARSVKDIFLTNISDFLRTPLITIMGADEMILRRDPTVTSNEYFFSIINDALDIKKASENLLELIDALINISKIESGKMTLSEKEYDTVEAMRSAVSITRHLCNDKGLSFEVEVDEKMPIRLYGDLDKLSQILWSLLVNAVKYTNIGGVILRATVDSIENGYCNLSISVKDTGLGFKEEFKEIIFNSFESLGNVTDAPPYDFGLGLTLSQMYAKLMGGTIEAKSEYENGAEFILKFKQKIIDSTEVGAFRDREFKVTKGLYVPNFIAPEAEVLIVDNDIKSLNIIRRLLKDTKMFVGEASTAEECLEKIKFGNYNVVLMDYNMPDMETSEILSRIHQINEKLPVYALTAMRMEEEEFYLAKGFKGVLLKPVDSDLLEKTIMRHIPSNIYMRLSDTEGNEGEDIELPKDKEWLYEVEEINVSDGIRESGGAGKYLASLRIFMDALNTYANGIEDAYKNLDIKHYTIKMHSLKTSFVVVGANDLISLAEALEAAGNRNDVDYITENTDKFLSDCRILYTKLTKLHSL